MDRGFAEAWDEAVLAVEQLTKGREAGRLERNGHRFAMVFERNSYEVKVWAESNTPHYGASVTDLKAAQTAPLRVMSFRCWNAPILVGIIRELTT